MGEELIVRVKALIRRNSVNIRNPEITIFDLTINTNSHRVVRSDNLIDLSPREYSLLEYLAFNKGKAQSRLDILSHVWGEEIDLFSNTVDVHIRYLRKKIDDSYSKKLIKTVKGVGYMLISDDI